MRNLKEILYKNNLNKSKNKFGTDKGDYKSYIDLFYEDYFLKYQNKKINILEIGFRNGASLFLWSKYFIKGKIFGLDNGSDLLIKERNFIQEWINQSNIQIKICNAYSRQIAKEINTKFDFIIDDGPHNILSQIKAILFYYPKLKKNGTLIIEGLLKGYISSLILAFFTPINADIKLLNFRNHKPGRDNMLFVIENKYFNNLNFLKRIIFLCKMFCSIPKELFYKQNIFNIERRAIEMNDENNCNLLNFKKNIFSQNGEDGILEELNKRLELTEGNNYWCVEFGAWDGIYLSNTYNLVNKGCNAIYIEGNKKKFKDLKETSKKHPRIIAINNFVSKNKSSKFSLDNILKNTIIPNNFDLLSIDIDSFDLEVWESLCEYLPKIVVIEINSEYPPGIIKWHSNEYSNVNGNSFSATLQVAKNKGYELVCHAGNMIFVRKEFSQLLKIDQKFLRYPELLYNDKWYSISKNKYNKLLRRIFAFFNVKVINKIKSYSFFE